MLTEAVVKNVSYKDGKVEIKLKDGRLVSELCEVYNRLLSYSTHC